MPVIDPEQVTPPSVNKLDGDDMTTEAKALTEDAQVFGVGQWVYCNQHLRPHETGWCTVSARDKVGLGVSNPKDAYEKCQSWGLRLYDFDYPFEAHTHLNLPRKVMLIEREKHDALQDEIKRLRETAAQAEKLLSDLRKILRKAVRLSDAGKPTLNIGGIANAAIKRFNKAHNRP